MTWTESLIEVVKQTGHQRYVWLCSDENPDALSRQAYRALMVRKASGEPEPATPAWTPPLTSFGEAARWQAPPSDPWLPLIRACEYHNPGCCSHPMPFCSLYLRDVTRDDCVACLQGRGISPDEAAQAQS
jgi:hypothetical protein